jgi:hypothetical protein
MSGDALDSFEGPRTIRYFALLLIVVVMLYVLGVVLADLHGITFLETATEGFVENPMVLLDIAGIFAFFALLFLIGRFVLKNVD